MLELLIATTLALGLSESIETRLPADPGMIYTVGFQHNGTKIGLDWKNRNIVARSACRKASVNQKTQCQLAAVDWLEAECDYYGHKKRLNPTQRDMQSAVCSGAKDLNELLRARQLAER